jgi:hypothetical protein
MAAQNIRLFCSFFFRAANICSFVGSTISLLSIHKLYQNMLQSENMDNLSVLVKIEELYEACAPICEQLSGMKRQTIGRRLENAVLSLLEYGIMAKNAPYPNKVPYLLKASALQEIVLVLLRIMINKGMANQTTLHQLQSKTVEIGRELGGWRKSLN